MAKSPALSASALAARAAPSATSLTARCESGPNGKHAEPDLPCHFTPITATINRRTPRTDLALVVTTTDQKRQIDLLSTSRGGHITFVVEGLRQPAGSRPPHHQMLLAAIARPTTYQM